MRSLAAWLVGGILCAGLGCSEGERASFRLATTTSTENSGLLQELLPAFRARTGVEVDVLVMGTGKALATGRNGDCEAVLVHAPELETQFVANGGGEARIPVMVNDFVVVGPASDPVHVGGMKDAAAALRKIRRAGRPFCSRGDQSGTHHKEQALWKAAGVDPDWPGYASVGQGMSGTLRAAWELGAYALTDRATWLRLRKVAPLVLLVEGDERLENPYHAILVRGGRPDPYAARARQFVEWLRGPEAQRIIGDYRIDGAPLFRPVAGGS